ncbi:MAG: murein L,D-transpeptidase [Betaproteobacteria bacterium ADurb.Bin341]|nr:MAG: murein L,D-transpeptidase [Betaproteobacteria bacterium ADurb.Bin341]
MIPVLEEIIKLQGKLLAAPAVPITRVEAGPALKLGSSGKRVLQLQTRLSELGHFAGQPGDQFGPETESAVRAFQEGVGLIVDGVVDHQTRFNLNLSDQEKLDILRCQLEDMERFSKANQDERYIVVNIPAYTLRAYESGVPVVESRVIVGNAVRQTPLMKSHLTGLVFNPPWSPPKTILAKDIFRNGEIQPKTVSRLGLKLIDAKGKTVEMDEAQIATQDDLAEGGYRFMQPPGDKNALGLLKFDLDNPYNVYLHDTNHRELFERQSRAFSSGCIRVERFRELAVWLTGKPAAEVDRELLDRRTRRLDVEKVPVHTVYWIADVRQGKLVFSRDIYERVRLQRKMQTGSLAKKEGDRWP